MEVAVEAHFSQADSSAVVPEPTTSRRLGEGERRNDPTMTRANRATTKGLSSRNGKCSHASGWCVGCINPTRKRGQCRKHILRIPGQSHSKPWAWHHMAT